MIELIVQLREGATAVHELKDGIVTIGRETDNTIIIADSSVSRHHAEVRADGGAHTLYDLNSANGTTVNGESITERTPEDGDVICFGTILATWVVKPPSPAPVEPESMTDVVRPVLVGRRTLVLGLALLVAVSTIALLVYRSRHTNGRTQESAAVDKHAGQRTKLFWDRINQIEAAGNQQGNSLSFGEYPKLEKGGFDFRWFDDTAFESFLGKLDVINKSANQVASELGNLDKTDVDTGLLSYTGELCAQWKSAADLDLTFARYVSALYQQHKEPEHPPSQQDIQALAEQWSTKRSEHQALSVKVIAREKSTAALLTERYQTAFK